MQTFRHGVLTDGVGFDNIAAAMVSVIQVLTYAAWSYMMYRMTDTFGLATILYFLSCIILGCYFVVSPLQDLLQSTALQARAVKTCRSSSKHACIDDLSTDALQMSVARAVLTCMSCRVWRFGQVFCI